MEAVMRLWLVSMSGESHAASACDIQIKPYLVGADSEREAVGSGVIQFAKDFPGYRIHVPSASDITNVVRDFVATYGATA